MSAVLAAVLLSVTASIPMLHESPAVQGRVVVECVIAPQGALTDCLVVEETPAGHGLGQRALDDAVKLKMDVPTVDGVPAAGARVRVPFSYRL